MPRGKRGPIVGLAAIDKAIKSVDGIIGNANTRVQEIAVAIVEHAAGAGNGDVSRALTLCQMTKKHRTMNTNFLVGWFAAFAGTNVNVNKGTVKLFSKDSKKQRGFRVDEARANMWYEAVDAEGNRATWYAGPEPETYTPDGIGDVAERMQRFVKGMHRTLDGTKTVKGKEVPLVELNKADREQVENALAFIDRIAATLARHERVEELAAELKKATEEAGQDDEVIAVIHPKEEAVG